MSKNKEKGTEAVKELDDMLSQASGGHFRPVGISQSVDGQAYICYSVYDDRTGELKGGGVIGS